MFNGQLVRLATLTEEDIPHLLRWRNSITLKRVTGPSAYFPTSVTEITTSSSSTSVQFGIHLIDGDRLVGYISLSNIVWSNRVADLGVYVGDAEDWGKGIGSEAVSILLSYAFNELNLHRIQLDVVDYNKRAIRLYNQLGFAHEGTRRQHGQRDGEHFDVLIYGILASEWRRSDSRAANRVPSL